MPADVAGRIRRLPANGQLGTRNDDVRNHFADYFPIYGKPG
jgi:hypothetical protein